jgi:hypothetical protein
MERAAAFEASANDGACSPKAFFAFGSAAFKYSPISLP